MVWGAIGPGFKSKLMFIDNTLNAEGYIAMLVASGVIKARDELYGALKWLFMQDGAPCHRAASSMDWLPGRVKILIGWPANSPDLNPIEMIWGIMKRRLNSVLAQNTADFKRVVQDVWDRLSIFDCIDPLVKSFKERIELVERLGGVSIQEYLHTNMARIGYQKHRGYHRPEHEMRLLVPLKKVESGKFRAWKMR
jgi:hypothetical protein